MQSPSPNIKFVNRVCIVLLIGLPGVGKSTLSKILTGRTEICNYICVEYDKNISLDNSNFKQKRNKIRQNIQNLINSYIFSIPFQEKTSLEISISNKFNSSLPTVFIIDDNFFYTSMRKEFYYVARECACPIVMLCLPLSIEKCLARNASRSTPISESSIIKMAKHFEWPNSKINPWEKFIYYWYSEQSENENLKNLDNFILQLFLKPTVYTDSVNKSLSSEKNKQITESSAYHRLDNVLRTTVNQCISELSPELKCSYGKLLNKTRKTMFQRLKNQAIEQMPNSQENFIQLIKDMFLENLNSVYPELKPFFEKLRC